jgi:hypothetical protein
VELQERVDELRARGLGVAAISYDSPEILAAFSRARGITFPLLSDPGSRTIKAFGILNTVVDEAFGPDASDPAVAADVRKYVSGGRPGAAMAGIPFPGTFILNRSGRVTSRVFEESYIERNTVGNIMVRLGTGGVPVGATRVSSDQLDLTTYASEPAVAPGNRFTLLFEVKPRAGIHVYAPGASGYRAIAVRMNAEPFVRTPPMQYPRSEIYFFRPLNERVPVYQKPFTLVQEVTLEGAPQAQAALRGKETLTLSGTLEYQACDDKICFNPVSLPLSWTLRLRPIVTERPARPQ